MNQLKCVVFLVIQLHLCYEAPFAQSLLDVQSFLNAE
jgi:hypothetical protein